MSGYEVFAVAVLSGFAAALLGGLFSYLTLRTQHQHEWRLTHFERKQSACVKLVRASHLMRQYLGEVLLRSENESPADRADRLSKPLGESFRLSMEAVAELSAAQSASDIVAKFWEARSALIRYQTARDEIESGCFTGQEREEIRKDLRESDQALRSHLDELEEIVRDHLSIVE